MLLGLLFFIPGGLVSFLSPFGVRPFGLLLGCRLWIKVGESKSVEVQRVWDVYDERLQFMSREDALDLDEALLYGDVSNAWMVWSTAAEKALADAFQLAGGPVPSRGLFLGRGMVRMRTVRLGGSYCSFCSEKCC